jgi:hypothetical protein
LSSRTLAQPPVRSVARKSIVVDGTGQVLHRDLKPENSEFMGHYLGIEVDFALNQRWPC